jgi:uncharacterized protein (DUF1800 family)
MEDGIKVIDLLARHPSTAHFISTKLVRRFVADDPPASLVKRSAWVFQQSNGDIREVLRSILSAPEFFSPDTVQNKVKKPLEFVASALRVCHAETDASPALLRLLARMGEPLFLAFPPTGFPDIASSWVSADALLTRINFVLDLTSNRIPGTKVPAVDLASDGQLVPLAAPAGLASSTRAALNEATDSGTYALVLAAPEFQRR